MAENIFDIKRMWCPFCGQVIDAETKEQVTAHSEICNPNDEARPEISVDYHPSDFRKRLFKKTDGHCYYCGVELSLMPRDAKPFMIAEHFIAKANGGSDRVANIVPACGKCNNLKGTLSIEDFRNKLFSEILFAERLFYFERQP